MDLFFVDPYLTDPTVPHNGITRHRTPYQHRPFVTFAGPWAQARWMVEHDPEIDDFDEALEAAWQWYLADVEVDGDAARYESRWPDLAEATGYSIEGREWEISWEEELETLWPVICEVAGMMLGGPVTHGMVETALERHLRDLDDQTGLSLMPSKRPR
ncbi:hypothetical protein LV457_16860 [Mycobacterium sp. MYCO198283]|uniref:hypothetical protein n=1 Tax=Mycobacterium sp. MYCO198283 TaxID=2883505 RepID=UPI001E3DC409|nr:hypothetical protein [Mycobacterium sp. MYCO198283]MCG5433947.1 hypothetical protein [Mycobacterium sp. MYCO198283]